MMTERNRTGTTYPFQSTTPPHTHRNVNYQGEWGLFYGGVEVFWKNLVAAVGVAAYSFVMAYILFRCALRFFFLK